MINMEKYIPTIHIEAHHVYIEMLVEGKLCNICKKPMIREGRGALMNGGVFPNYIGLNIQEQVKNGCLEFMSHFKVDDKEICITCKEAGRADFVCQSCHQRKSTDKMKESIGDPPDFLCVDCYNTVPAAVWDSLKDHLYEEHKYGYQ